MLAAYADVDAFLRQHNLRAVFQNTIWRLQFAALECEFSRLRGRRRWEIVPLLRQKAQAIVAEEDWQSVSLDKNLRKRLLLLAGPSITLWSVIVLRMLRFMARHPKKVIGWVL